MTSLMERAKTSFNILFNRPPTIKQTDTIISSTPTGMYSNLRYDTNRAVLAPVTTRIAIDAANIPVNHVIVDEEMQYVETKKSELNDRLTIMANIDQSGTAFIQDAVQTMLYTGACALVPVETSADPRFGSYDILSMRVGTITQWYNRSVEVEVYNENTGTKQPIILAKSFVAIAYNPMYAVINETNSTLRRLIDKLALLDVADGRLYSQQLDLILQLPYTTKHERRQEEAARRLAALEEQLYDRKYGVAYVDAAEKITQLNRPVTNALVETVEGLTESLHSQLGLTPSIFSGTAEESELVLYNNRTLLPIMKSLTDAMRGTFFSRTAITQGHSVMAFPNLFKMAPLETFADAADKLTRNEIMTSNEIRGRIGLPPSEDPEADKLRNKNLNKTEEAPPPTEKKPPSEEENTSSDDEDNKEQDT